MYILIIIRRWNTKHWYRLRFNMRFLERQLMHSATFLDVRSYVIIIVQFEHTTRQFIVLLDLAFYMQIWKLHDSSLILGRVCVRRISRSSKFISNKTISRAQTSVTSSVRSVKRFTNACKCIAWNAGNCLLRYVRTILKSSWISVHRVSRMLYEFPPDK